MLHVDVLVETTDGKSDTEQRQRLQLQEGPRELVDYNEVKVLMVGRHFANQSYMYNARTLVCNNTLAREWHVVLAVGSAAVNYITDLSCATLTLIEQQQL